MDNNIYITRTNKLTNSYLNGTTVKEIILQEFGDYRKIRESLKFEIHNNMLSVNSIYSGKEFDSELFYTLYALNNLYKISTNENDKIEVLDAYTFYYYYMQILFYSNYTPWVISSCDIKEVYMYFFGTTNLKEISDIITKKIGNKGEERTNYVLKWIDSTRFTIITNENSSDDTITLINKEFMDEPQEIDHMLIGDNGLWLIETKNLSGIIYIDASGNWSRIDNEKVEVQNDGIMKLSNGKLSGMENPLFQIRRHEKVVKSILYNLDIPIHSVISLSNANAVIIGQENSKIPTVKSDMLGEYIETFNEGHPISKEIQLDVIKKLKQYSISKTQVQYNCYSYNQQSLRNVIQNLQINCRYAVINSQSIPNGTAYDMLKSTPTTMMQASLSGVNNGITYATGQPMLCAAPLPTESCNYDEIKVTNTLSV